MDGPDANSLLDTNRDALEGLYIMGPSPKHEGVAVGSQAQQAKNQEGQEMRSVNGQNLGDPHCFSWSSCPSIFIIAARAAATVSESDVSFE